jgi:hypothetical protein
MARFAFLLAVLVSSPDPASAYCLTKMTQGTSPYAKWVTTAPVTYRVSNNLTDPQLLAAIDAAFATWGAEVCSTLKLAKGAQFTPCFQTPCAANTLQFLQTSGHINVFWYKTATGYPSNPQYVAYMYITHDGAGTITNASIAINGFNYKWNGTGGSGPQMILDLQNAMTGFIGNVIGLDDSNVPGASMYPGLVFGDTSKRTLAQDDIDGLVYLYKATGCPAPPPPGANGCSVAPPPDAGPPSDGTAPSDGAAPGDGTSTTDAVSEASSSETSIITPDLLVVDDGTAKEDGTKTNDAAASDGPGKPEDAGTGETGLHDAAADRGPSYAPAAEGCCRVGHGRSGGLPGILLLALLLLLGHRRSR